MRVAVIFAFLSAFTVSPSIAEPRSGSVKDWTFRLFDDGSARAQTLNDSGSVLGVYCVAAKNCQAYLLASTDCEENGKYPVLMNSTSGAKALDTTCTNIGTPDSKPRFALLFDDFESVVNLMFKDRVAGFSIPMADGTFKVTRFSLDGSNEALAAVNQAITKNSKPVGLKDQVL
jgi:hypothetical protein